MKKLLVVLLTMAVLICPVLAAGAGAALDLSAGSVTVAEEGTYTLSGSSAENGVRVETDGYVTLVLTESAEIGFVDCGEATVYLFFGEGVDTLTVGSSVFHGSTVITGVLGTVTAAAQPAAAQPAADQSAASGEPAAAQSAASGEPAAAQSAASGEPAAQSAASGEPAAAASGETAASTETAASGETASAEPAAEETAATEVAADAIGANITAAGWSTIELVCVIVLVVECAILMLSFGKKKTGKN